MPYHPPINAVATPNTDLNLPNGQTYYINSKGQIVNPNGTVDPVTANVDVIGYTQASNGQTLIWQKISTNQWWYETGPNAGWTYAGTTTPAGLYDISGGVTDTSLNIYNVTSNYQISVDGVVDPVTNKVTNLVAPASGGVWQQNVYDDWYFKATPANQWSAPTYYDPILGAAPSIWKGGGNNSVTNAADWTDGGLAAGKPVLMNSGTMDVGSGNLDGNTLNIENFGGVTPPTIDMSAGSNVNVSFYNNDMSSNESLDVSLSGSGTSTLNLLNAYGPESNIVVSAAVGSNLMLEGIQFAGLNNFTQNGGTFVDNGQTTGLQLAGGTVMLNCNLGGNTILPFDSGSGNIEVTGSIAATTGINAYGTGGFGNVILNNPAADLGSIMLDNNHLQLNDMAGATTYTYNGSTLDIFGLAGNLTAAVKVSSTYINTSNGQYVGMPSVNVYAEGIALAVFGANNPNNPTAHMSILP